MMTRIFAVTLTILALAGPLSAQPTEAQRTQVMGLWTTAFEQWGPVFTCGAIIPKSDKFLRPLWSDMRTKALARMSAVDWPADELAALTAQSEADALRLPLDTPFSAVIDYCAQHEEWLKNSMQVSMMDIGLEVEKALTDAAP